jgi:hypothetical protein
VQACLTGITTSSPTLLFIRGFIKHSYCAPFCNNARDKLSLRPRQSRQGAHIPPPIRERRPRCFGPANAPTPRVLSRYPVAPAAVSLRSPTETGFLVRRAAPDGTSAMGYPLALRAPQHTAAQPVAPLPSRAHSPRLTRRLPAHGNATPTGSPSASHVFAKNLANYARHYTVRPDDARRLRAGRPHGEYPTPGRSTRHSQYLASATGGAGRNLAFLPKARCLLQAIDRPAWHPCA